MACILDYKFGDTWYCGYTMQFDEALRIARVHRDFRIKRVRDGVIIAQRYKPAGEQEK